MAVAASTLGFLLALSFIIICLISVSNPYLGKSAFWGACAINQAFSSNLKHSNLLHQGDATHHATVLHNLNPGSSSTLAS
ncbi:hypothetical protein B0T17DRAFT_513855 [Bombardia bombarda]|uniref:Uncharacterized protein n=1 Tax=Bombardia bombarda TaxID=252184 RepID=A0AA39XIH6_9PEZI|nr:hypothetical protein B0T17DRAFT_513855 [Bombardia bombarda]